MINVFKFGGASVKDADSVRNMASIVSNHLSDSLVVVISAMGKTTNAIERIHKLRFEGADYAEELSGLTSYHEKLVEELFDGNPAGAIALSEKISALEKQLSEPVGKNYDEEYDKLIGYGELISTAIVHAFLSSLNIPSQWFDARELIKTDDRFRDARVNWEESQERMHTVSSALASGKVAIIQGFIGSTLQGQSTSLGREGSDFTASILAFLLNANAVTIWKDVPGMLNADPKKYKDTVKLDRISFKEAIELAYYGASVIHPKTIKPLQNKGIPLHIKSFVDPQAEGSTIQENTEFDHLIPCYILKENQVLLSISTRDFSFIVEDNLKEIFDYFSQLGIRIHLMENSAISFSVVFDFDAFKLKLLIEKLEPHFQVKYNTSIQLLTIRHWNSKESAKTVKESEILLEQRSRYTLRLVVRSN
jgi:aspartate kinase